MPGGKAIIAAGLRFKLAWDVAMAQNGEGLILSELEIAEVHEAALELIAATGTQNLQDALETLSQFDS